MLSRIISMMKGCDPGSQPARFEKVQLATCALLLEVAYSDGQYQAVEAKIVHDLLADKFQLSPAAVADLVEHAQDHRSETHDLFQFAREINTEFSNQEKLEVMEAIWRIIYADGTLDKFEDALARQMSSLLRLSHKDVIDLKVRVLDEARSAR